MMNLIPHDLWGKPVWEKLLVIRLIRPGVAEILSYSSRAKSPLSSSSSSLSVSVTIRAVTVLHTVRQVWRRSFDNTMLFNRSVKRKSLRQLYSRESQVQIQSDVHTITCLLPRIRLQAAEDGMEGNEQRNQTLTRRLFTLQAKFYRNIHEHSLTPKFL
jgi:hypothetical protein